MENSIGEWKPKTVSMGFDFTGVYDQIIENELITYKMSDGRKVEIKFIEVNDEVKLIRIL